MERLLGPGLRNSFAFGAFFFITPCQMCRKALHLIAYRGHEEAAKALLRGGLKSRPVLRRVQSVQ